MCGEERVNGKAIKMVVMRFDASVERNEPDSWK
jgi:hypothetical protein